MIPAAFEYERVDSVDAAIEALKADEGAKLLAGGHSLLPQMKLRFAMPSTLIDIGRLRDLSYVRGSDGGVAIGALTRYRDLETSDELRELCPIVASVASQVGDPQVRHMGTIGGSVAHADPAGDMPSVLLALGATFVAVGPDGSREIAATDMFPGLFESALAHDEVLTEIRVPTATAGWSYQKFTRRAQDWAVVGVAAIRANGGTHVTLTNMGLTPLRAAGVEEALAGGADPASAAERADEGSAPPSDAFASDEYRRHLAKVLVRRALEEALR
ncbi:MAG TPA: xanthine dehydrogenase family protein subunit M [Actinomycetota bacterium]|nr:xanthine dehydrogenase family protein subunit M [Actinomycetota bacterium]